VIENHSKFHSALIDARFRDWIGHREVAALMAHDTSPPTNGRNTDFKGGFHGYLTAETRC
jgi:hypothetical protein